MTAAPRRTQQQRREATVAKLSRATIDSLADLGYRGATVSAICERAGVSQGALFRHFTSRGALVAHAMGAIADLHVAHLNQLETSRNQSTGGGIRQLVVLVRDLCRTPVHAAWHEVVVAARTDVELAAEIRTGVDAFQAGLIAALRHTLPLPKAASERMSIAVLSLMHCFDSEAMTRAVFKDQDVEDRRLEWSVAMLESELSRLTSAPTQRRTRGTR